MNGDMIGGDQIERDAIWYREALAIFGEAINASGYNLRILPHPLDPRLNSWEITHAENRENRRVFTTHTDFIRAVMYLLTYPSIPE
jgi:hypothetical protein